MHDWTLQPAVRGALILGVAALPFLLSAAALLLTQFWQHRRPTGHRLPQSAGPWLAEQLSQHAPSVGLEIHNQEGLDAFFPGVDAIGLSDRTWNGRTIAQRTIAAHELGHAINITRSPLLATWLPIARLATEGAWKAFIAALLVGALFQSTWVLWLAWCSALLAVIAGLVVLADEGNASLHGYEILRSDRSTPASELGRAIDAMRDAFSLYASIWTGQMLTLIAWPLIRDVALDGAGVPLAQTASAPAMWLLFLAMPFLILRAVHVVSQIWRPEPVGSEFRLFTVMQREAQWEFLTGFTILIIAVALYDQASGPIFLLSMILAVMTALGPLSAVGRASVLFPILLLMRKFTRREQADDEALFPETRPEGAAPALMALYDDPPWYLRMSWAANLAYLPLVLVLVAKFAV